MLDEEARAEYGITEELPSDLDESCDALLRDEALVKVLGGNMVSSYVSVIKRRALNGANPR
jgi:glutamine synthetase